jgi:hypothetical protein
MILFIYIYMISILIPIKFDSLDRRNNLEIVVSYIHKWFPGFRIALAEQKESLFYKTRLINETMPRIQTEYMAIWDCDVLLPRVQIIETIDKLNQGYETVYPYDGTFLNVGKEFHGGIRQSLSVDGIDPRLCQRGYGMVEVTKDRQSFGGCVFFRTEAFKRLGMMNEGFKGYGPEDAELGYRMMRISKFTRISGPLFHLDHVRKEDSVENHAWVDQNHNLFKKILDMDINQLKEFYGVKAL